MKARSFVAVRRVGMEQPFVSPSKSSPKKIDRPMTKERFFIVLSKMKWRCGNESKLDAQMAVGAAENFLLKEWSESVSSCLANGGLSAGSTARIKELH